MERDRPLEERGESLEEEFFRKQNQEIIARMRAAEERERAREHLRAATGIEDVGVLDRLLDDGVTHATVTALALAPLVAVAWADRRLEDRERRAVLHEADDAGIEPGTPEHEQLQAWLLEAPGAELLSTWSNYAQGMIKTLPEQDRADFSATVMRRCRAVAQAAGGFAGMGRVSPEEQRVLAQVEAALKP